MRRRSSLKDELARLNEQEALAAEAERIAHVGTFVFDVKAQTAVRSAEMMRIWGFAEREGPSGLDVILERIHPDDHAATIEDYRRMLSDGGSTDRQIRLVMEDGSIRHVHIRGELVHLPERTHPVVLGTVQDVTERHLAEETIAEQTRRLKEMQSELIFLARQSAMGTMAATLAHELNQPLTALASYSAGLRRMLDRPHNDASIRDGIDAVQQSALRAGEIIRRMREMARQGSVRGETVDIEQLAREAARFTAIGEHILSVWEFRHAQEVRADPIQIQQVLVNLLRNAREAVEAVGGGSIKISTEDSDEGVRLCVTDTGPGIDPAVYATLFEAQVSTKPQGMGIGLSICRTIIEAHGGRIWAESLARGARICFALPRDDQL